MLRWKRPLFTLAALLLLLAACSPETVEVTRVVTETETVTETVTETEVVEVEVTRVVEGETIEVTRIVSEIVTEEVEASDEEAGAEAEESVVDEIEATGSERDDGQLPAPDGSKVGDEREQTAVLDPTADANTRAEPVNNSSAAAPPDPLTAGEIDDNVNRDAYQAYLASYTADDVIPIDVRQRFPIAVQDGGGNPVLDAQLIIRTNGLVVTVLRTHSDGTAVFYPAAYERQGNSYEVEAIANGTTLTVPLAAAGTTITFPATNPTAAQLDIVILLDATLSMRDEIDQLKTDIEQIASQVAAFESQPNIRLGLVAYRDVGDDYVTQSVDFTASVAEFAISLNRIEAAGGGDYPEALTPALSETVETLSWRETPTVRLVFLVADAPPHVDGLLYTMPMITAAERGIKIYPLASSGLDAQGEYIFRQLAQFTNGRFLFLTDPLGQPSGDTSVSVDGGEAYTIAALDDLIIAIIREELSHLP